MDENTKELYEELNLWITSIQEGTAGDCYAKGVLISYEDLFDLLEVLQESSKFIESIYLDF